MWALPVGVALAAAFMGHSPRLSRVDPGFPEVAESPTPTSPRRAGAGADPADTTAPARAFPISLHATAQGMKTWYGGQQMGFELLTGIPYERLSCKSCHEPALTGGCASCHDGPTPSSGARPDASLGGVCGDCHSRQTAEAAYFSDVHREAGMDCLTCHTREDVMGDGVAYASMLEDGAIDATCETCHADLAKNPYHDVHAETVDCSSCHVQSVVSCYNCHFETELQLDRKVAYAQFRDWVFLMNRNGKVQAANLQAVMYGDHTFVALAPFYAHTISRNARECLDCHGNAAVRDYLDDGVMDVAWWDESTGGLRHLQGVVPVPPDYRTALRFDFVDLDGPGGTAWSFLESGPDAIQILFGEPLTESQMESLALTARWRSSRADPHR